MRHDEFTDKLKQLNLSKSRFADMTGKTPQAVTNWNALDELPSWVDSWLDNYAARVQFDELKDVLTRALHIEGGK